MRLLQLFLLVAASNSALAQGKPYAISLSYGWYAAPSLKQSQALYYLRADFTYTFAKSWSFTSGFLAGQFAYYDDVRSNAYDALTRYTTSATNARGYDFHTYALIKHRIVETSHFQLRAGIGIGMLTERLKYPYREPCSSGCAVFIGEHSSTSLELPLQAEAHYLITDRIDFGLTTGVFINPSSSNFGLHVGPQIRINL